MVKAISIGKSQKALGGAGKKIGGIKTPFTDRIVAGKASGK